MALQPGARIGAYEIVAALGAGGMGEVYRARDARLGRDVAIKILAPHIGSDRDALTRFEREARALAALNHPNIAAIYDVIDAGGQPALVLELVDGETLADRIAMGRLPSATAIEYARQIADALDTAHEAGIVHRDLKPGNIKITDDGRVKVLDFGLAKAMAIAAGQSPDLDPANSPTITVHGISQNVILGTAAYMSPEQARGKRIDKRTDIWAFGCVLFEMLTGKRAFTGETTSDVIAAIIERAPHLEALPSSTPPHLRRIIQRCLEKDPKRRARDIADVRTELEDPVALPGRAGAPPTWRWAVTIAAAAAAVAAVATLAWRRPPPDAPLEFTFGAPAGYTLSAIPPAPSPDGRHIAFVAADQTRGTALFVRLTETGAVRRLDGSDDVVGPPAWSPDGRWLAFAAAGVWKRIAIEGGPPITIAGDVGANLGATWTADETLLLAPANRTSLARVPIAGGPLQAVTTLDTEKENSHRWPQMLPDRRHFLFTARSDQPERLGIKIGELGQSASRMLINVASQGVYVEPGWLLFVTPDEVLMAQRLDPSTWTLQGNAQPVVGPVRYNGPSFNGAFSASLDGRIVAYAPARTATSTLEWFDRGGQPLGRVGPERDYRTIRLSNDARRVAVELADAQRGTRDIWLVDTTTQALTRFTSHPATDWRPVFSPDGTALAFASDRAGMSTVFRASVERVGSEELFYRSPRGGAFVFDWSRDGKYLLVPNDDEQGRPLHLLMVPADGGAPVSVLENEMGGIMAPRFSPGGDRVAFVSRGTGGQEIYVMSIRDRRRVQVSTQGGYNPRWNGNGRELFFENLRSEIMHVMLDGVTVTAPPSVLFRPCVSIDRTYSPVVSESGYEPSADGTRFLAICRPADSVPEAFHVIVNWQSKLR